MTEPIRDSDEITINILGEGPNTFGSRVSEKREPLQIGIVEVTPTNLNTYFPDKKQEHYKTDLEDGKLYMRVAIDPSTSKMAGFVEVRRWDVNALSVEVEQEYQRRGVASQLIRQAQKDHDLLVLLNFAGKTGEDLYTKMGFVREGIKDRFVWKR